MVLKLNFYLSWDVIRSSAFHASDAIFSWAQYNILYPETGTRTQLQFIPVNRYNDFSEFKIIPSIIDHGNNNDENPEKQCVDQYPKTGTKLKHFQGKW